MLNGAGLNQGRRSWLMREHLSIQFDKEVRFVWQRIGPLVSWIEFRVGRDFRTPSGGRDS